MHCGRGLGGLFCDLSPAAFPAVQSPLEEGRGITSGLMPVPPQRRRKGCPRKIPGAKFCRCDSPERSAPLVQCRLLLLCPSAGAGAGQRWPLASPSCCHARPRERERGRGDRRHLHNAVEPVHERRYDARPIRTKQNLRLSRRLEWVLQGSQETLKIQPPAYAFPRPGDGYFILSQKSFSAGRLLLISLFARCLK